MPEIILTNEQLQLVVFELTIGAETDGLELIDDGEWADEGKCSYNTKIFKYQDKFYAMDHGRSGSPFTDYFYDVQEDMHDGKCQEVEQTTVTVTVWKAVPNA